MRQQIEEMLNYFLYTPLGEIVGARILSIDFPPEDRTDIVFFLTMNAFDEFEIMGGGLDATPFYFTERGPVIGRGKPVEKFLEQFTRNIRFTELIAGHGHGMQIIELEQIMFFTSIRELNQLLKKYPRLQEDYSVATVQNFEQSFDQPDFNQSSSFPSVAPFPQAAPETIALTKEPASRSAPFDPVVGELLPPPPLWAYEVPKEVLPPPARLSPDYIFTQKDDIPELPVESYIDELSPDLYPDLLKPIEENTILGQDTAANPSFNKNATQERETEIIPTKNGIDKENGPPQEFQDFSAQNLSRIARE